jgi:hypothetical protein
LPGRGTRTAGCRRVGGAWSSSVPPSNVAVIVFPLTGDRPGRNGVVSVMVSGASCWSRFVCGCFQDENLKVKPWQPLPCNADLQWLAQEEDPLTGRYAAARLLERLLELDLSRWELDPRRAIAAAEYARRGPHPPDAA